MANGLSNGGFDGFGRFDKLTASKLTTPGGTTMKFWLILAALFFVSVFVISQVARGQGNSPVGVIPEGPPADTPAEEEPDINPYLEMTLNLSGGGCEINLNESELLRVKGVVGVDIEKKPGKVVLEYDPAVTNKGLIKSAVGKKKGGCAANEEVGGGG